MESALLVAPVTALEFFAKDYLFAGAGPILSVYTLQALSSTSASLSVLQNQRIHGIRLKPNVHGGFGGVTEGEKLLGSSWKQRVPLVVFGGKAVRLVEFRDGETLCLDPLSPVVELQDWVLDVHWLCEGAELLGIALAHNSVLLLEVGEGHTVALCSCQEGCLLYSALLVGQCWDSLVMVGGTVFNQLVIWKPGGADGSVGDQGEVGARGAAVKGSCDRSGGGAERKKKVERRLHGHSGVIFGLAYLPESGWLASASDDRSVRVWGVGALGGDGGCGALSPPCLRVLYGHQARVFSVRLSCLQVFSAGEDGACLIWDWESGRVSRALRGHRVGGVRALAVSRGGAGDSGWMATGGADGGIRLWRFEENDGEWSESLQDLGFQGRGCPKVVRVVGNGDWRQGGVVVSTDQGEVYMREGEQWRLLWQGGPEFQSYSVMELLSCRGQTEHSEVGATVLCVVGSLSGEVWVFPLSQPSAGIQLNAGKGKIHSVLWANQGQSQAGVQGGHLFVSGADGLVHRWMVECLSSGAALRAVPLCPFLLPLSAKRWLTAVAFVSRPEGALWLCGDRRGSLLLYRDEVEGVFCDEREVLEPASALFGSHGKQGVTWVCEHQGLLYSTGRDGCVRVLRVGSGGSGTLEVLRVQRACQGMEWVERIFILDPEVEQLSGVEGQLGEVGAKFLIVGFHSVHFVVWDLVRQERLLSVLCGGGHRSWSYCPPREPQSSSVGTVVFVKQGAVLASHASEDIYSGGGSRELKAGLHGRGIGCVCCLGAVRAADQGGQWEVLVTGGEDTSLSVLAVQPQSGTIRVLSIITDHISSVRALAAVRQRDGGEVSHSRTGRQTSPFSALLFSAGGRAQLQCYRLLINRDAKLSSPSCQVIQVAGHRLDEQWERLRNRHKTVKMDPETRYMSLAVVDDGAEGVLLALACSDGALRLFSISETSCKFHLLWESFYHQRCVLSVASCCLKDPQGNRKLFVVSAATDGRIAVWDVTSVANITNGLSSATSWKGPTSPCFTSLVHQSGVNTLAVWEGQWAGQEERDGQAGDSIGRTWMTIASGGDDGQLSAISVGVKFFEQGDEVCSMFLELDSRCVVPLAHSAPLTALRMLTPELLISASSDQRVCLWILSHSSLHHREVLFSHVADAAGLEVWYEPEQEGGAWVAVCGQGLQLLRLKEAKD